MYRKILLTGMALVILAGAADLTAQSNPATNQQLYKDPGTATLYSIVSPGVGQLWVGDTKRGAMLLGVGLGAPILGAVVTASTCSPGYGGTCSGGSTAPFLLGLLAGAGAWVYGIIDANDSAQRMNQKNGVALDMSEYRFTPVLTASAQSGMGVGVSVRTMR